MASDPHYTTFDGVSFQFESPCTYVLSKVCDASELLSEFAVEVQNERKGDSHVSSIQQVNVNIHGLRVTMLRTERSRVMVSDQPQLFFEQYRFFFFLMTNANSNADILERYVDIKLIYISHLTLSPSAFF